MIHRIKLREDFSEPVYTGVKNFEVRYNDRGYQAGDIVIFTIVDRDGRVIEGHPMETIPFQITYVLSGEMYGIAKDYVVFGIRRVVLLDVKGYNEKK